MFFQGFLRLVWIVCEQVSSEGGRVHGHIPTRADFTGGDKDFMIQPHEILTLNVPYWYCTVYSVQYILIGEFI